MAQYNANAVLQKFLSGQFMRKISRAQKILQKKPNSGLCQTHWH